MTAKVLELLRPPAESASTKRLRKSALTGDRKLRRPSPDIATANQEGV